MQDLLLCIINGDNEGMEKYLAKLTPEAAEEVRECVNGVGVKWMSYFTDLAVLSAGAEGLSVNHERQMK